MQCCKLGRTDINVSVIVLAWLRRQAGVASILVRVRKPEEVDWNLPSLDLSLPDDVLAAHSIR
jgi:aryl-alcohol dehydrogenase-like predicted oxidoreductase